MLGCQNGGFATTTSGSCQCQCVNGFGGSTCTACTTATALCPAGNTATDNGGICTCVRSGCSTTLTCLNGGIFQTASCSCLCPAGFTGSTCGTAIDPTDECLGADNPCANGQRAFRDCHDRCICKCGPGLAGPYCEVQVVGNLCEDCEYVNGVGFVGVQNRCDMFVKCELLSESPVSNYKQTMFQCGPGTLWDQNNLVCNHPDQVTCADDQCLQPGATTYTHAFACQEYWRCNGGRTAALECCPPQHAYDTNSGQCVPNTNCPASCRSDAASLAPCPGSVECDHSTDTSDPTFFSNRLNQRQQCAPGTIFNDSDGICTCVHDTRPTVPTRTCANGDHAIEFNDFNSRSYDHDNVALVPNVPGTSDRVGRFSGNSRVILLPFSNSGFDYANFIIRARVNIQELGVNSEYAVLANGDCDKAGTLAVTIATGGTSSQTGSVYFRVRQEGDDTDTVLEMAYTALADGWVTFEAKYIRSESPGGGFTYEMSLNVAGTPPDPQMPQRTDNKIASSKCALQIGHGDPYLSYMGFIDWVRIWATCVPLDDFP